MKQYQKLRIMLITFALGLASVFMFDRLSETPDEIKVNLPRIETESAIILYPIKKEFIEIRGGGGGETVEEYTKRIRKEKKLKNKARKNRLK